MAADKTGEMGPIRGRVGWHFQLVETPVLASGKNEFDGNKGNTAEMAQSF